MNARAYYNEIEPFAAQWLRNLITAGHIAPGDVDQRSIAEVRADELRGYTQCHFFAGIGVWSHALRLAGWPDHRPVWTGSCPCQPFSTAGRRHGHEDERHLWPAWFRLISERAPESVLGEQVANGDGAAWLDHVAADLESHGYTVGAVSAAACSVGAPHIRQRLYFVAGGGRHGFAVEHAEQPGLEGFAGHGDQGHQPGRLGAHASGSTPAAGATNGFWSDAIWLPCRDGKARPTKPGLFPLAHGAAARVGRLRAYGNAIVPQLAAEFIRAYLECRPVAG